MGNPIPEANASKNERKDAWPQRLLMGTTHIRLVKSCSMMRGQLRAISFLVKQAYHAIRRMEVAAAEQQQPPPPP
jgi:hypothetical protein